jgi:hypothetical protein
MNRKLTPRTRLENLRKEAKRWLGDLRRNEAKTQERLRRVYHDAPAQPGLRHVQYALERLATMASHSAGRFTLNNARRSLSSVD